MMAHGVSPNGPSRCKRCGATSERIKCPYCGVKKEHVLGELHVQHKTGPHREIRYIDVSGLTFQQALGLVAYAKAALADERIDFNPTCLLSTPTPGRKERT